MKAVLGGRVRREEVVGVGFKMSKRIMVGEKVLVGVGVVVGVVVIGNCRRFFYLDVRVIRQNADF